METKMRVRVKSLLYISVAATAAAFLSAAARHNSVTPFQSLGADSSAVAAVVDSYHKALASGDSTSALNLLAPDAVILESGGMETRAEYRSHHLPGDIGFARGVKSIRGPLKVTLNGTTAWTSSTSTTQGEFNGRAINSVGAESVVLTKSGTSWRIRSIHWSSRNRRPPA
jgi:ketosteroid isomerase-like protein